MTGFALLAFAVPAQAQVKVVGDWHGVLQSPVGPMTLVVTIGEGEKGALRGDMESVHRWPSGSRLGSNAIGQAFDSLGSGLESQYFSVPLGSGPSFLEFLRT